MEKRCAKYNKLSSEIGRKISMTFNLKIKVPVKFRILEDKIKMEIELAETIEAEFPFNYVITETVMSADNTSKEGEYRLYFDMVINDALNVRGEVGRLIISDNLNISIDLDPC